jgi:hypothetical protein
MAATVAFRDLLWEWWAALEDRLAPPAEAWQEWVPSITAVASAEQARCEAAALAGPARLDRRAAAVALAEQAVAVATHRPEWAAAVAVAGMPAVVGVAVGTAESN